MLLAKTTPNHTERHGDRSEAEWSHLLFRPDACSEWHNRVLSLRRMAIHFSGGSGCVVVLAVLFVPAAATSYFLNDPKWLVIVPAAIAVSVAGIAALGGKRKVTPQQWASEIEPHLLGTEGPWDWDDAISVGLADPRLEALRVKMPKFDSLDDERRTELATIIAALKRGEIPEIKD